MNPPAAAPRPTAGSPGQRRELALAMLLMIGVVIAGGRSEAAVAAAEIHVAPWGRDGAAGTADEPVETLGHAVWRATSGDSIVLHDGVYREHVQILGKALTISSAPGERAVLDGSVPLNEWQRSDEDWFVDDWVRQFPAERGDTVTTDNRVAGHPDQVFFDGRPLDQVLLRSKVEPGTFFHDTARDRIYIGDDPTDAIVESSELDWGLYFNDADGSRLSDVTVRRYGTPIDKLAAIRVHSDDVVVSGVTSELNAAAGISAIGADITIVDSRFTDNGYLGVHAHRSTTLVVEGSTITGNNQSGFDDYHSAAGLKITSSSGVTVRGNDVSRNGGPGIWTDLAVDSATISYNTVEQNGRSGIEVELSSNVDVISNVVHDNGEAGIWVLESQHVRVAHNATSGNFREVRVLEGPRAAVQNVTIFNNVLGNSRGGQALVQVDDWTHRRSADEMGVRLAANAYWLPATSPVQAISQWGDWPTRSHLNRSISAHETTTGGGDGAVSSTAAENPFLNVGEAGRFWASWSTPRGQAVTGWMAQELGVPDGTRLFVGPTVDS